MGSFQQAKGTRREYGIAGSQVVPCLFLGVGFVAGILPISYEAWRDPDRQVGSGILVMGLALLAMGAYLLTWAVRARLTIDGDEITVRGAFDERSCRVSELAGYRMIARRYRTSPVLYPRDGGHPIDLSRFATDEAFRLWLEELPNLDALDAKAHLNAIEQSEELGATREDRLGALGRARSWAIGTGAASAVAAGGLIWGPQSWRLPCAMVLWLGPVVAFFLLHRSPLLFTILKRRGDPRAELVFLLIVPGMGLMFGTENVNLVAWAPVLVWMAPVALLVLLAFYHPATSNVQSSGAVVGLLAIGMLYSWGAALSADTFADGTAPKSYAVHVTRKYIHVTSGRNRSTTYYLRTEPWGPYEAPIDRMKVSMTVYRESQPGDVVCVGLRPGLLHAPWFEQVPCESGADRGAR